MPTTFKFKFASTEAVEWFKSVLNDLNKINTVVRVRLDGKNVLLYAMNGKTTLKCAMKPINEVLKPSTQEYQVLDFIFINAKNMAQNLNFFKRADMDVDLIIKADMDREVYAGLVLAQELTISNGDLKLTNIGGGNTLVEGRITLDMIKAQLNPDNAEFSIQVDPDKIVDIKRLSTLNSTDETVFIRIKENAVYFAQKKWELKVADVDGVSNDTHVFFKKYLSSIIPGKTPIQINFFSSYISIVEEHSYFMIALESAG